MADYTTVDGCRVAPAVARDFARLASAFAGRFGLTLIVSDGTRTYDEQKAIFLSRYVPVDQVGDRRVYDYRWWNGIQYARISGEGTVAQPGTSLHESDRALDVRDSGADRGVSYSGTERSNWLRDTCGQYGFAANGLGFGEPWHIEYQLDPWAGEGVPAPAPAGGAAAQPSDMLTWAWTGVQRMLKGTGRYSGLIDDDPGPGSIRGIQSFVNDFGFARTVFGRDIGITGAFDAETCKAVQQWLQARWGYTGRIDAEPGDLTHGAWNLAEQQNGIAFAWVT